MVMKGERVELECEVSEEGANVKWSDTPLNAQLIPLFETPGSSSAFSRKSDSVLLGSTLEPELFFRFEATKCFCERL